MSREIIAVVRLAYGEVGYYDELSRIHLTAGNPQKEILAGTNCTQLRRSVKSGRLRLISGSLGEEKKLDFLKKGNKFTSTPQVVSAPAQTGVVPETPVIEATDVEDSAAESSVVESGIIEIEAVKVAEEEIPVAENNAAVVETEAVGANENAKKSARKKAANKQEGE